MLHELGPVLGLRGGSGEAKTNDDQSHPKLSLWQTMMDGGLNESYECPPHQFDTMALYAVYQSR